MMETNDRMKIDKNLNRLVQSINMEILWPKLIEHGIFSEDYPGISKWRNNWNNQDVKKNILIELKSRGPYAFQKLLCSLQETNQNNCVLILERSLTYDPSNTIKPLEINVKKSTSSYHDLNNLRPFDCYPMNSEPRGIVLIMLLYNANDNETGQKCAEHDEKNLKELFSQMNFTVIVKKNLDALGIKRNAKEFSQKPELRQVDCFFFIVIGNNVQDTNYVSMSLKHINQEDNSRSIDGITYGELIHYFNGQNCPNLLNKPKIFMFHFGSSIHVNNTVTTVNTDDDPVIELNLRNIYSNNNDLKKPRNYSDMLISFSIMDGAFGMTENGSQFVQIICETFMEHAHNIHLKDLFQMINERLKSPGPNSQNVPCFLNNIGFRRCFLNP